MKSGPDSYWMHLPQEPNPDPAEPLPSPVPEPEPPPIDEPETADAPVREPGRPLPKRAEFC